MHRPFVALCAVVVLVACSKGNSHPDAGTNQLACQVQQDCASNQVCISSVCVPICHSATECSSGLVCEEGICLKPACGNDAQCGAGQACINGACASAPAASQVASCSITPGPAVVGAGSKLQLTVVAQDSAGKALHFTSFTWSATGAGATIDASGMLSASADGDAIVTATVQGAAKSCSTTVHSYGAPATGALRVTAINIHTKQPVAGAKVVLDTATTAQVTGADGTASYPNVTGVHDVHVFASGYSYTSYVQTDAKDLLVPLTPLVTPSLRSGFTGHMCSSRTADPSCQPEGDFSPLIANGGGVHLAFFGSAIPNSLLDLSVATLVGPLHPVVVKLIPGDSCTSDTQCKKGSVCSSGRCYPAPNLPYGLVLGVADDFFGTQDYRVFADGGLRALWGIGGNLALRDVVAVLSPVFQGGGNLDIGTLLPALLPFFAQLQAGTNVGVTAPANATPGHTPSFSSTNIALTTPMRIRALATSPDLPKLDGAYVDGVLAIAGALDYPIGFVPLGLTAGLSYKVAGANGPKVLDPTCTPAGDASCATGKLPMKMASENGGTEGSKIAVALLALNFGAIAPGSTQRVAVSGQIKVLDQIDYVAPPASGTALSYPPFMSMPTTASVTVGKMTRQVAITGDADPAVQIYRFELENHARLTWNIWMGKVGTSRTVTLPDPSTIDSTLIDPFKDAIDPTDSSTAGPTARLLGLAFSDPTKTASGLESFGSPTLDAIGGSLSAFTAVQVPVQ
jgi:hypothetical protein